jgi:glycosyltransferase involved in cell wall biosynthesis
LKSPFVSADLKLLQSHFKNVDVINLDNTQKSKMGNLEYLIYLCRKGKDQIHKCDVVYIWFAVYHALPLILLSKLFGKRSILWVGGWEVAKYEEIGYGNQLNKIHGYVSRWCINNADVVLIPSQSYKNMILGLVPDTNVYIIHQTIDSSLYTDDIPEKTNKVVTGVFAGDFTHILKGLGLFEELGKKLPYEFQICDGMPHDEFIKVLKTSKVYCQFSYTESFGIALVEAMACKCVPVVSDRDSMPEIVGESGIIVPYGNVNAAINAIREAMMMDGDKAREKSKDYMSENRMNLITQIMFTDLVSVVIPSYNSSKWLPETIKSIEDQTYKNIEIIVVDDCSTDNTQELIKSMANPRIKYIRNDVNKGECISSRVGFEAARGKYICRLSSDDMYANNNKIIHQVQYMDDAGADWSYNSINCVGETIEKSNIVETYWMIIPTRYGHKFLQMFDNLFLSFPRIAFIRLFYGNPVNSSTLMFRSSSYLNSDKWSDKHRTDCDGLLLYNLLLRGSKGIAISEMGSFYRTHPQQMSYNPLYIDEMKSINKEMKKKLYNGEYPLWLKISVKLLEVIHK